MKQALEKFLTEILKELPKKPGEVSEINRDKFKDRISEVISQETNGSILEGIHRKFLRESLDKFIDESHKQLLQQSMQDVLKKTSKCNLWKIL